MSRPFNIREDDHSEKAQMMRKAFEKAFNEECYYCEENIGTSVRHGKLICGECNNREIRTILDPRIQRELTEEDLALQLRVAIYVTGIGRKAKGGKGND